MATVCVLGAGLVGAVIARDLAQSFEVTAVDRSPARLTSEFEETPVHTIVADLREPGTIKSVTEPFDLVVGALPGWMGRNSLKAVLEAGKNTVDIAFFPEDPFPLHELAKRNSATAIIDMGVAPGMSNVILGHHVTSLRTVDSFECLVGGLPFERKWPFEYKAPFSPSDVLEEYTRPARYREQGVDIVREALSDPELVDFDGVGTLESFLTDGLRTLTRSYSIPNMKEKTLRYPGHRRLIQALRAAGFLDDEAIELDGVRIRPRDFTSRILFPLWQLHKGEPEFTVMRLKIKGKTEQGESEIHLWNLHDRYDTESGASSMARTTGFACTAAVHLMADGKVPGSGICPPEKLGEEPSCFEFLLSYLAERNVHYRHTIVKEEST